jgi:hypothetical protein
MLGFKVLPATVILAFVLIFLPLTGTGLQSGKIAYGQFFDPEANGTNSSNSTLNSTSSENADIVLLSQKLKKASFGYRDLVGQVKNIGGDDAGSVVVRFTAYDKDGGVMGTDYTYADVDTLKPDQKSTFKIMMSTDDVKGMDHYDLSLEWSNPDGSQGYVENAKIYEATTTYTETSEDTDTDTNTGTHNSNQFPETSNYCDTVKTQLGKELCDKLLS